MSLYKIEKIIIEAKKGTRRYSILIIFLIGYSMFQTWSFITAEKPPTFVPLPGEVTSPPFDSREMILTGNVFSGLLFLILSPFLCGRFIQKSCKTTKNKIKGCLGGMLLGVGLIVLALSEFRFPESVIAQLIACGISIGCSLAAWRMFSHMQQAGILGPNKNLDERAHV